MKKFLLVLTLGLIAFGASACGTTDDDDDDDDDNGQVETGAVFSGVQNVSIPQGPAFDPMEGVTATDEVDGNLTGAVLIAGSVDVDEQGAYELLYLVTNSRGITTSATRTVTVTNVVYPTGTFNYKFADAELRHTLFAAAERYLLETMYGGVPLFANSGFVLYSERMILPTDEYLPIMGYSAMRGEMSEDDSNVIMRDGELGNAGEYTYRTSMGFQPSTLNQWIYDDSASSDIITLFLDSLYFFDFNDDMTGYEVRPSMATGMPEPIDSRITETNVEVSYTWQVSIKDDLVWTYHDDTDTSTFEAGHEAITADDFINTFKHALDEGWFRAISGGGDFFSAPQEIENARNYYDSIGEEDPEYDWEDVGLKAIDDFTLEFTFANEINEWGVIYWLSSFVMHPVNFELLEVYGDQYGTTPETVAYTGPFKLDIWEDDLVLLLSENPNFHDPDRYFITGVQVAIQELSDLRFRMFEEGETDVGALDPGDFEQYANDPRLRKIPGAVTFRMMINGLGTAAAQEAQFPGSGYTPEPLLANDDFRMALYFGVDREYLAWEVMVTSDPQMYHFSDAYMVEPEAGIAFRHTPQGEWVGQGFSPSTYGFNEDAARAYWVAAIEALVEDGTYEAGDEIELMLVIQSGSTAQANLADYLKEQFEGLFTHEELGINVIIDVHPAPFPDNYYTYMMPGLFDLGTGGISGSTLDASSFLRVYADDNRGGFTLNWGIDTTTANIEITYFNPFEGEEVTEVWSYNALVSVLNGEAEVILGQEASVFE